MGQCGCGDFAASRAFRLKGGGVLAFSEYYGCSDCDTGLMISLSFFDRKGARDWLDFVKIERAPAPDEYGGNGGNGLVFPLFGADEIRKAAKEIQEEGGDFEEYGSLDDWLADYALELLQRAMRMSSWRRAKDPVEPKAAGGR